MLIAPVRNVFSTRAIPTPIAATLLMTTPSPVVPSGVLVRTPGGSCPEGILSKFIIRDRRAKLALTGTSVLRIVAEVQPRARSLTRTPLFPRTNSGARVTQIFSTPIFRRLELTTLVQQALF